MPFRLRAVTAALAAAAALAGCGAETSPAPPAGDLVADAARAVAAQTSVHYALDLKADVRPGSSADGTTKLLLGAPLAARVQGGLSPSALVIEGRLEAAGRKFEGQALVGRHETYVQLYDQWFGDPTQGLADARRRPGVDREWLARLGRDIRRQADGLLDGRVSEGPELDGTDTWLLRGRPDPDGLERLVRSRGKPFTAEDRRAADALAQATELSLAVGRHDDLPRRLELTFDADAAALDAMDTRGEGDAERARIVLDLRLFDYGKPVEFAAPRKYGTMQQLAARLLSEFLGLAFSSAGRGS